MIRLQIGLSTTEAEALARWAISEMRDPRDQIRFLLQQELQRRGLLPGSGAHGEQGGKHPLDSQRGGAGDAA